LASLTASRQTALGVLRAVRSGDLADRALDRLGGRLAPRDFGWTQELVYGTLRLRGRLDHILAQLVRGGLERLEPDVLDVLRLGAYQLLEMSSVPPYAAISQSVELARFAGAARAAGLVNGVLHFLQRDVAGLSFPDPDADPAAFLESWGSHPRWLVERWLQRWDRASVRALVEADNTRPELFLRPVGIDVAEAIARLAEADLVAEPVPLAPDSLRLLPPASAHQALALVPAVVQDPAAALVVRYAAVPRGAVVIDLCSAPGGKAAGAAASASFVAAADLSPRRLGRLRQNVERLGLASRVGAVVADARRPPFAPADLVLLDAPCTGTGTIRRHPDGRWRVGPAELADLVALQSEILDAAAPLVRPDGVLVYSTCSLEPEENETQVSRFLDRHPAFERAPAAEVDHSLLDADGQLVVLPQRDGMDGAFAARLRRVDLTRISPVRSLPRALGRRAAS
jgi:16S rRNA (cytosine967-C5)-methyltransferase